MNGIFVDTSGWASFFLRTEPFHRSSVDLLNEARRNRRPVVTANYVVTEVIALLTSPFRIPRAAQIGILDALRAANWTEVVHIDPERDQASVALLKAYPDKTWSLVDCSSFVVMRERGLTSALTNDRHFEQAGFIRLLKSN